MIRIAVAALLALAACGGPRAEPNPMSVPNVLQSITETRTQPGVIFMTGGIYDGGAAGQTARFVVTPDDRVICTFEQQPVLPGDGTETTVTAHRLSVPGIYAALAGVILPNIPASEFEYTTNFTVEVQERTGLTSTKTGFGEPRFERLNEVFRRFPTPCWAFG